MRHLVMAASLTSAGFFYLQKNDGRSHFMTTQTTLLMYEALYGPALDLRREKLSLQGRKACLQPGGWSAHGQPQEWFVFFGTPRRPLPSTFP